MLTEATQLMQRLTREDPTVHLLDDIWLLTVFVVLIVIVAPWLFSGFDLQFVPALLGLVALGVVHVALAALAAKSSLSLWHRRSLTILHLGGVTIVGVVWRYAGNLQNPAFLLVFALPVIGGIFLSRWHAYVTAAVAVGVVVIVALIQVPELRWYASGLTPGGAWIGTLLAPDLAAHSMPFSGFYAPSRYFVVVLEVFAIALFACAAAADYMGAIFKRLSVDVSTAQMETERGRHLWTALIDRLPMAALLVEADTALIVAASERAKEVFGGGAERGGAEWALEGRRLFEAVQFTYPDLVQDLVNGDDGQVSEAVVRIADTLLVTHVRVRHLAEWGRRFALVLVDDCTQAFGVRAALDVNEQAILVIDGNGRVLSCNKPAAGLFSGVAVGDPAPTLTSATPAVISWWDPGAAGRRKMHVAIPPRVYQVTCSAITLPGEDERISVVALAPVARAAVEGAQAGDTTVVSPVLVQSP